MNRFVLLWFLQGMTWYYYTQEALFFLLPIHVVLLILIPIKEKKRKGFFVGMSLVFLFVVQMQLATLPGRLQGLDRSQTSSLEGRVVSFPQIRGDYVQWILKDRHDGANIQCNMKREHWNEDISYGQELLLNGRFELPEIKRNPGGFDYRKYLYSKNVGWTFFARSVVLKNAVERKVPFLTTLVQMRGTAIEQLERGLKPEYASFGKGILFGEKAMEEEEQLLFSQLGIAHILSVSGLHIGVLYGFSGKIFSKVPLPGSLRLLLLTVILGTYAFWCGFSPSVIRACGMVLLHALSLMLKKSYDSLNAMAWIGCLTMLKNPYVMGTSAFLLSYGAVFFISILYGVVFRRLKRTDSTLSKIGSAPLLSLCVFAGMLPITTALFHWVSPLSILLNVLVIPLASTVLLLLLTSSLFLWLGMPQLGFMGMWLANKGIQGVFFVAHWGETLPWSGFLAPSWPAGTWFLFYMMLLTFWGYLFRTRIWMQRGIAVFALFLVLLFPLKLSYQKEMTAVFLDVGQGDSAVFQMPDGKVLVVDGGGHPNKNVGEEIVLEALLSMGIRRVDVMICTHSHEDHQKGLEELMENIPVGLLLINGVEEPLAFERLLERSKTSSTQVLRAHEGMQLSFGPERNMTILSPGVHEVFQDANNASLVLRLKYDEISFLMTGDMERDREEALVQSGQILDSQVLKIPHHGSQTSSSAELLSKVKPEFAVISVGKNNAYGHPAYKTLEQLELKRVQYYRTDQRGAVIFTTNGKTLQVQTLVKE